MIMSKLIIFVCVSNTCRSPMCEYMLRDILQKNGLDNEFTVSSRSITEDYEPENSPANERGIEVMINDFSIDTTAHRSRLLTKEDVEEAYLIIPVKKSLGLHLSANFPSATAKLLYFAQDIPDPWRQPYEIYLRCAKTIQALLNELLSEIIR